MAARFPQSGSSVAYKIKAAYASKVLVMYWAAGADSVHRLRTGETATTILTRSTSGATFNSTDGLIEGNGTTDFEDSIAGGYGGLDDNDNFTWGVSYWGDFFNGLSCQMFRSRSATTGTTGLYLRGDGYYPTYGTDGSSAVGINSSSGGDVNDDVVGWMTMAIRNNQSDATAKQRAWLNGYEDTSAQGNHTPSWPTPQLLGDSTTGTKFYFGRTAVGSGNTKAFFEFAFFGTGDLTDAELAAITADPTVLIEVASSSETITLAPDPASVQVGGTRTFTATRSAPAGAGGVTYNVSSDNPAVATVPTPQALTEADSDLTFDATGASVGTANITITNAADSSETDTVALTVTAVTTKRAKFLVHPDFASATGITIEVNEAPTGGALTGAKLGFATGIAAEATLESGQAVIKVNAADVGASALAAATNVVAIFKGTTSASSPLGNAVEGGSVATAAGTIIEE